MSKYTTIIVLGIFIALMPFLGFPQLLESIFLVFSGLGIAALSFSLKKTSSHRNPFMFNNTEKKTDAYIENNIEANHHHTNNTQHDVKQEKK